MCLRSRGRAKFRRRRKSLPPPPAEFWSAHRCTSRIWFVLARKVAAARLRGLPPGAAWKSKTSYCSRGSSAGLSCRKGHKTSLLLFLYLQHSHTIKYYTLTNNWKTATGNTWMTVWLNARLSSLSSTLTDLHSELLLTVSHTCTHTHT